LGILTLHYTLFHCLFWGDYCVLPGL
jgi:hypothetical protein